MLIVLVNDNYKKKKKLRKHNKITSTIKQGHVTAFSRNLVIWSYVRTSVQVVLYRTDTSGPTVLPRNPFSVCGDFRWQGRACVTLGSLPFGESPALTSLTDT